MISWIFLPTLFFMFDMLLYFLLGYSHIITIMGFVLFSFFNHNVPESAQMLGLFYALLQASIFYNTVLIVLIFCVVIRYLFSKIALFLRDGFALHLIMTLVCIGFYVVFLQKIGLIGLKNYTVLNFFTIIILTLAQSLFLNSIYGASGQSNRLRKARGKSGHQTGNVPFDKIRTGNKYC
jgi:hypothetical protein